MNGLELDLFSHNGLVIVRLLSFISLLSIVCFDPYAYCVAFNDYIVTHGRVLFFICLVEIIVK